MKVQITEQDIQKMVSECVKRILKEEGEGIIAGQGKGWSYNRSYAYKSAVFHLKCNMSLKALKANNINEQIVSNYEAGNDFFSESQNYFIRLTNYFIKYPRMDQVEYIYDKNTSKYTCILNGESNIRDWKIISKDSEEAKPLIKYTDSVKAENNTSTNTASQQASTFEKSSQSDTSQQAAARGTAQQSNTNKQTAVPRNTQQYKDNVNQYQTYMKDRQQDFLKRMAEKQDEFKKMSAQFKGDFGIDESIDIKKKNKGKFTATKKETGKSTEELTHSKNPLTRKRAIFAQNAKKWKHKK